MAGHAPEYRPLSRRILQRIDDLSDIQLSIFMFAAAFVIFAAIYILDRRLFG